MVCARCNRRLRKESAAPEDQEFCVRCYRQIDEMSLSRAVRCLYPNGIENTETKVFYFMDEGCKDADCLAEREADAAERLAFVGKLTEIMIAVAREVECPKVGMTDTLKAKNYFDSYDNDHDAMMLLWQAWDAAPPRIRRLIVSAIGHLRESAMEEIPYSATTPNKDSFGRYHGKRA